MFGTGVRGALGATICLMLAAGACSSAGSGAAASSETSAVPACETSCAFQVRTVTECNEGLGPPDTEYDGWDTVCSVGSCESQPFSTAIPSSGLVPCWSHREFRGQLDFFGSCAEWRESGQPVGVYDDAGLPYMNGHACAGQNECGSGACVSVDGTHYVCASQCEPGCPPRFECHSGFCFPSCEGHAPY